MKMWANQGSWLCLSLRQLLPPTSPPPSHLFHSALQCTSEYVHTHQHTHARPSSGSLQQPECSLVVLWRICREEQTSAHSSPSGHYPELLDTLQPLAHGTTCCSVLSLKESSGTLVTCPSCCSVLGRLLLFPMWLQDVSPFLQNHFGPLANQGYLFHFKYMTSETQPVLILTIWFLLKIP